MAEIELIACKRTDPEYKAIRDRHYIPNKGCHGQQLHYMVRRGDETLGIISGASSVWAVAERDRFFGITKDNRKVALPSIVNNVVFRLEVHEKNLATRVLALWRRRIAQDWFGRYGVHVAGFETFVIEADHRKGCLYKADNWALVGETQGRTKAHTVAAGLAGSSEWLDTEKKLIFVKAVPGVALSTEYHSSWRRDAGARKLPPIRYGA